MVGIGTAGPRSSDVRKGGKRNKLCCLNIKFFYYLPNGFR